MAMKKCKECGEEISSSAKTCPKCGKKQGGFSKVIIILLVLVVIIAVVSGSGNDGNVSKADGTGGTAVSENGNKVVSVGEVYEGQGLKITYLSLEDNFTGYNQYADVGEGNKIIRAEFEFENTNESDAYVSAFEFECYADGYDCESFIWVDDSGFSATLSKGKKVKGNVYFEVPQNAEEIHLEYETDYWNNKKVEFKIK